MRVSLAKKTDMNIISTIDLHISEQNLEQSIKQKRVYLLKNKDEVIGILRYNLHLDLFPLICFIYIKPKYRNKHLATKLLTKFEKDMIKKQFTVILTSIPQNFSCIDFFKKNQYTEAGYTNIIDEGKEVILNKSIYIPIF